MHLNSLECETSISENDEDTIDLAAIVDELKENEQRSKCGDKTGGETLADADMHMPASAQIPKERQSTDNVREIGIQTDECLIDSSMSINLRLSESSLNGKLTLDNDNDNESGDKLINVADTIQNDDDFEIGLKEKEKKDDENNEKDIDDTASEKSIKFTPTKTMLKVLGSDSDSDLDADGNEGFLFGLKGYQKRKLNISSSKKKKVSDDEASDEDEADESRYFKRKKVSESNAIDISLIPKREKRSIDYAKSYIEDVDLDDDDDDLEKEAEKKTPKKKDKNVATKRSTIDFDKKAVKSEGESDGDEYDFKPSNLSKSRTGKKRIAWTDKECIYLVYGVQKHGKGQWSVILAELKSHFAETRTSVDLKDKYRNLEKNQETLKRYKHEAKLVESKLARK